MAGFNDLPTELRQRVLWLAMPHTNYVTKALPRGVLNLLQVDRRLRLEMDHVIDNWSPLHYVAHFKQLKYLKAQTENLMGINSRPNMERICIKFRNQSMVNNSTPENHPSRYTNGVRGWMQAVPLLPQSVKELYIDTKSAPLLRRVPEDPWAAGMALFLGRSSNNQHLVHIGELLKSVNEHYSGCISLGVAGSLRADLSTIERFAGIPIELVDLSTV